MAETTHTVWRRERFREQRDPFFSIFFCSIRRPYITFKLPRRDKDMPLRLCNLPDIRQLGCVTSAHLEWPVWSSSSGNNCHAVHRSLSSGASLKWDLHLVPYYQPSTPAWFLSIIGHWDVSHPLSSELQVWSSSSGNNYHAVHRSISSGASLFLRHSENFYLVSYCEPSCILHSSPSYFSKCSLGNILSESLSSLPTPHKRSNCTTEACKSRKNNKSIWYTKNSPPKKTHKKLKKK